MDTFSLGDPLKTANILNWIHNGDIVLKREEIRNGIACVKHQIMSGSNIGDDHKEYFAGEAALKAGGKDNTMNQFG
jgi:isocitrate lyase